MTAAPRQWQQLNDDGSGVSTTTMVAAPQQRWRLHDNNSGSMATVMAKPQRRGLNDNGNSSTTTVAAPRQWRQPDNNDSLWRQLHTDRMVVCLKLDGCCLYCALSNSVIVYRTLLILDGNSRNVDFSVSTPLPSITHGPINCKFYDKWGDSVALEIGWR